MTSEELGKIKLANEELYERSYRKFHELYEYICDTSDKNLECKSFTPIESIPVWDEMGGPSGCWEIWTKDAESLVSLYDATIEAAEYIPSHVGRCPHCGTMGLDEIACCDED